MGTFYDFVIWLQNLPVSVWIREAFWPFPVILSVHVIGMGLVAGAGFLTGLRLLGAGARIPLNQLYRLGPATWVGAVLAIVSGAGLFLSYPAKALTNPPFVPKLAVFFLLLVLTHKIVDRLAGRRDDGRLEAGWRLTGLALILGWLFVIGAGRILAYTYSFNDLLWYPAPEAL